MESAIQGGVSVSLLKSRSATTGEVIGSVPTITAAQVQGVVDEVARIQPAWAQLRPKDRARYMLRAGDALLDELDEIAELLVREQGKPRVEAYTMELLPTGDALHWVAKAGAEGLAHGGRAAGGGEGGAEDPRRRAGADDAGVHAVEERPLLLRADRRGRGDRALELPLVDPLRRGGDRADGGQRGGAEAGLVDAAAGREDPRGVRARRRARGARPAGPRRRPGRRGARPLLGRQGLLHRLGRGRAPRRGGLRVPAQGQRAG